MAKIKSLFVASAFVAAATFGMASGAQAQKECAHCAKAPVVGTTTVKGKTTRSATRSTRTVVKNVNRTKYVRRIQRVVNTHYRQHTVHVRRVTRVHHRTVVLHTTQRVNRVVTLPTKTVVTNVVQHVRHPAKHVRCGVCR